MYVIIVIIIVKSTRTLRVFITTRAPVTGNTDEKCYARASWLSCAATEMSEMEFAMVLNIFFLH